MSNDETLFNPDDPRLTAYALGELTDGAERAQVEQLLAASPEARAELADIRALSAALTAEYEQERAAAESTPTGQPANVVTMPRARPRAYASWLKVAALLVALGLAVGVMLPNHRDTRTTSAGTASQSRKDAAPSDAALPPPVLALATVAPAAPPTAGMLLTTRSETRSPLSDPFVLPSPTPGANLADTSRDSLEADKEASNKPSPALNREAQETPERVVIEGGNIPDSASTDGVTHGSTIVATRNTSHTIIAQTAAQRSVGGSSSRPVVKANGAASAKSNTVGTAAKGGPATRSNTEPSSSARSLPGISLEDSQVAAQPAPMPTPGAGPAPGDGTFTGRLFNGEAAEQKTNTADYVHTVENSFLPAKDNPLSTFSIDVDTASYSIVRRFIDAGSLPPADAVRVEEFLNYFPYEDAPPAPDSDKPFAIHLEAAACPWNTDHRLVRIGIKGKEIDRDKRPPSNLVFLLDVSGSMMPNERLPLVKKCLHLLVEKLREDDHVAIVVYAGESGLALPSTSGDQKDTILRAIDNLHAGGSTNGASGIRLAYQVARKGFIKGATNRVILSTDGDFNVGVTGHGELLKMIEEERKDGISLSVLGVGTDNLKDSTMQILADHGNGNYAYIDRLEEGEKVLVNQMSGTLVTIAKNVKIQVEFNPATVASYRLIGYEKRLLKKEDFNDDRVDAGEIGAGHSVTALYEVAPAGQPASGEAAGVDPLKYQPAPAAAVANVPAKGPASREMLTVKMRQKAPDGDESERTEDTVLVDQGAPGDYANASPDFKFAAAVASFGMVLRDSPHKGSATLGNVLELAQESKGEDPNGYRAGFIELVRKTQALQRER